MSVLCTIPTGRDADPREAPASRIVCFSSLSDYGPTSAFSMYVCTNSPSMSLCAIKLHASPLDVRPVGGTVHPPCKRNISQFSDVHISKAWVMHRIDVRVGRANGGGDGGACRLGGASCWVGGQGSVSDGEDGVDQ